MTTKSPNSIDAYVGSRVRMQRLVRGMSQEKLGEQLGVTFQQVQKYEQGTNRIGASRLQNIANVLGVPVSFFFQQESNEPLSLDGVSEFTSQTNDLSSFMTTKEGLTLNRAFMSISDPKVRRTILALVKSVADGEGYDPAQAGGESDAGTSLHN